MGEQEYASFSSLLWQRVTDKHGQVIPHRWRWRGWDVWGEGCNAAGLGGTWYSDYHGRRQGFPTQFDAQAAVEIYVLELYRPEILMDDVELLWDLLEHELDLQALAKRTGFDCGRLSDALARAYELGLVAMSIASGAVRFKRETKRRKW